MNQSTVLDLAREALVVGLLVASPLLAVTLLIGIVVSVFQAVTQVQELTLTFVPKVLGILVVMLLLGSWMLTLLVSFLKTCFESFPG